MDRRSFLLLALGGSASVLTGTAIVGQDTGEQWAGLGRLDELQARLGVAPGGVLLRADHRLAIVRYDPDPRVTDPHAGVAAGGLLVLGLRCPINGPSVEACDGNAKFECIACASRFTRDGRWMFGPAAWGLPRHRVRLDHDFAGRGPRVHAARTPLRGLSRGTASADRTPYDDWASCPTTT